MQHSALISPYELHELLQSAETHRIKIIDATYGIPGFPASAIMNFNSARIGNAAFFDIDAIAKAGTRYAHTLPSALEFSKAVSGLGIQNTDTVIVYDQRGIAFAAARAWWMFRVMGHQHVRVLNGGLPAWQKAGYPLQSHAYAAPAPTNYIATLQPSLLATFEDIEDQLDHPNGTLLLDARGPDRYHAQARTEGGEIVAANIPHSQNMPFTRLLETDGTLKPTQALQEVMAPLPLASASHIQCSCNSGVTACVLALALHEVGYPNAAIFDGSWTEWSDRHALR